MNTKKAQYKTRSKKPYASPILKRFGTIKELTTGGTPGAPEGVVLPPGTPPIPRRP